MTSDLGTGGVAGGFAPNDGSALPLPLFRPEAIGSAGGMMGRPIAVLPISWGLIGVVLATIVLTFGIFLSVGTFSRKESAPGIVRATGGDIRIEANAPGVASYVPVAEGQSVRAGETLLVVDTPRNNADGRSHNQQIIESLDRELASLFHRVRALEKEAAIERGGMSLRIAALQNELDVAVAQEATASARLSLAKESLDRALPAAKKGFISGEAMRRRQEEVILLRQAVADARGTQSRLQGQIAELRTSEEQRPLTLVQERGQLQDSFARIRRDKENYASQQGYTIKAPANGTISAVQISRGQAVAPQRQLMTLSRPGSIVSAEIFVASRSIGFLELGQEVKVSYDAFPSQHFGFGKGRIRAISSTVLRPDDVEAAVRVEEPVYRVLIDLKDNRVHAYGKVYRVRPGLAINASIILEKRTFAQWLLDPLLALRGHL